jgi:hypothetical protein
MEGLSSGFPFSADHLGIVSVIEGGRPESKV